MVADFNTMPKMFSECNKKYFNRSLPTPKFGLFGKFNTYARFEYEKVKDGKKPIKNQKIAFSKYYDFDEDTFRALMVHEMIHYYIKLNDIKDNKTHGDEFTSMADDILLKYGIDVTPSLNPLDMKTTENAPKNTILKLFW